MLFTSHCIFYLFFFLSKELFFLYRPTDSFAEHLLWSFVSNSICITKINFTSDYLLTSRKWQSSSFQCLFMPLLHLCMGDTWAWFEHMWLWIWNLYFLLLLHNSGQLNLLWKKKKKSYKGCILSWKITTQWNTVLYIIE